MDYLIKVRGYEFTDAVQHLAGDDVTLVRTVAPKARPPTIEQPSAEREPLRLPRRHDNNTRVIEYLQNRGIDEKLINDCIRQNILYESADFHNVPSLWLDTNGKQTIVIGGAYSIDKAIRITYGWGRWEDEQPSEEIKRYVKQQLEKVSWKIDVVLSHTTPLKYEPVEVFMSGVDQSRVDKSTEIWLDYVEEMLSYEKRYCGHYHTEKKIDKLEIMFEGVHEL